MRASLTADVRDETIALSTDEKELLDEAADDIFGTTDVPYGATVSALASQQIDVTEVN